MMFWKQGPEQHRGIAMLMPIAIFICFALIERFGRGYVWPREPYWVLRGGIWTVLIVWFSHVFGEVLHHHLSTHSLFALHDMGLWGIIPSFILYEFLLYGFHRALHGVPALWRIHQWHHSSERIDVWSTYRTHPFELVGHVSISFAVSTAVLGLSAEAAFFTGVVILVIQSLQHTNLRTPVWLGYIIMRPESHMLHHERNAHRTNYCDLPLIDAIFGTFVCPKSAPEAVGFWDGASRQIGPMLRCEDVTVSSRISQQGAMVYEGSSAHPRSK